jgi:hypothetical protein
MKKNKPSTNFWGVLATVNVVAVMYPISLLHRAESTDETLFAAFALMGSLFVLMVIDAVSIVVADVIGNVRL